MSRVSPPSCQPSHDQPIDNPGLKSFEMTKKWRNDVLSERGEEDVLIVLVGNKADRNVTDTSSTGDGRQVTGAAGEARANEWKTPNGKDVIFMETSAKVGLGVKILFNKIARALSDSDDRSMKPKAQSEFCIRSSNSYMLTLQRLMSEPCPNQRRIQPALADV